MFVRTTAVNKILALKKRKKVIQGGSSASKTYSILAVLIDKAAKTPRLEISVVSESIPHLRRGAIKDFAKIMKDTARWNDDRWNKSLLTYSFANGSFIEFFSADQEDRLRGARRNVLYINEANNIDFAAYYQLAIRTSHDIYIDFNPSEEFWVHSELLQEDDTDFIILTYHDNEALPENVINDFRNAQIKADKEQAAGVKGYWYNWCQVYIHGVIGSLQGAVFNNWTQCENIPKAAEFIRYGLDFGFTNDPTAMVGVWRYNGELYVKQYLYESGLTNQDISNKLNSYRIDGRIIADSAEPKSIEELRRLGHSIEGANKGKDSIVHSINTLQQYRLNITKDSIDLIKELRSYKWITDNSNKLTNEPVDYNNHLIDALRYVALNAINQSTSFDYSFG
jgi:phage terminase large subunit